MARTAKLNLSLNVVARGLTRGMQKASASVDRFWRKVRVASRRGEGFNKTFAFAAMRMKGLADRINTTAQKLAPLVQAFWKLATIIGVVVFAVYKVIKVFAEFQHQMAFVSTMLSDTDKWMGKFTSGVASMATRFGQSTKTVSKALYDILSAGIPAKDALMVLKATGLAATAGFTTMAIAGKSLAQIMNAMGIAFDQVGVVSDVMFMIVKRGVITYEELATNMGESLVAAKAAGITLEELASIFALMTRKGFSAAKANISIARAFQGLARPTEEAINLANRYGIAIGKAAIEQLGYIEVIRRLKEATAGREDMLKKLFPSERALRSIITAVDSYEELRGLFLEMGEEGVTQEAALKHQNTLVYQSKQWWQSILSVLREIGEFLEATLMPIVNTIVFAIRGLWILVSVILRSLTTVVKLFWATLDLGFSKIFEWLGLVWDDAVSLETLTENINQLIEEFQAGLDKVLKAYEKIVYNAKNWALITVGMVDSYEKMRKKKEAELEAAKGK